MPVTIQDDMLEAADCYQEPDRSRFIAAMVSYGISGVVPDSGEPWYPAFVTVRGRLEKSAEKMSAGKILANARWHPESQVDAHTDAHTDAQAVRMAPSHDAENENGTVNGNGGGTGNRNGTVNGGGTENGGGVDLDRLEVDTSTILDHFNRWTGTNYTPDMAAADIVRKRLSQGHTVQDLDSIIKRRTDLWKRDAKMRSWLTLSTLFGDKHFNEYLDDARANPDTITGRYSEYVMREDTDPYDE